MLRDEGDVEGWGRHHVMGKPCGAGMASDGGMLCGTPMARGHRC